MNGLFSRTRFVDPGPCVLEGRAWSGWAPVERVEVSADGGNTWSETTLGEPVSEFAWHGWRYEWDAEAGEYELSCRASDAAGHTQPTSSEWNFDGLCNNAVQRVQVIVSPASEPGVRSG